MMLSVRNIIIVSLTALMLTACGGGPRITYTGHEESTEGVPGFSNGKKLSPNVKLGQSYTVDGDLFVPRFQPDYAEVGMASWYGPGFHGGKTANGEEFDKHSMTAAHPTLPLPSIVKVTLISTGKSAYVRINDRGPYAAGRIIDLSYAAAKEIGMIAKGTAKVKVEYDLAASQRFADLLAQGRAPESIDVAEEVLPYAKKATQYATVSNTRKSDKKKSILEHLNPVASANAEELLESEEDSTRVDRIAVADLPAPGKPVAIASSPPITIQPRGDPPPQLSAAPTSAKGLYIQLGSFTQHNNAAYVQHKVAPIGAASIALTAKGSRTFYRVRLGPYQTTEDANNALAQLRQIGMMNTPIIRQ